MLVLVKRILGNMSLLFALFLVFCSRQTGVESQRFLRQPTFIEARPLSSSRIYLAWKGPINHPGGLKYRIYLKKESESFERHQDLSGSTWNVILDNLEANVRYTVCVRVVDDEYEAARSGGCDELAVITTPAQQGHVSKTDRKYLTKAGFYRGARHWWPFDYETKLRDIKYSRDGRQRGTSGVSISGKPRGYLSIDGNGWVRLGKFLKECVCDVRYCSKSGVSVGLWIKLSRFDNDTKIILGSDTVVLSNTTGFAIFQTTRTRNGSKGRFISALVFLENYKWKCNFAVEPGVWFYLTITWSNESGLRMFKDGELMSEQKRPKSKARVVRHTGGKCTVSLSPPSVRGPLTADYDDLVIWKYELKPKLMYQVYRNVIDPPRIIDCKTLDGKSADVYINDNDHIYDIKGDYNITWKRRGSDESGTNITKDVSFRIKGLARSSEYIVEVRRRMFVSTGETLEAVLSKPSKFTCNTRLYVPKRPKNFTVREKADKYFSLQWQQPSKVYGSILGYKISYRVDDFSNVKWTDTFRANVNRTTLRNLKPFTDYIIKLSCQNQRGSGKAVILRATTAVGVPTPPRRLRVKLKGEIIVIKWREPEEMRGMVKYRLFALVNGTKKTICDYCDESYQLEDIHQYTTYKFWIIAYNINEDPKFVSKPSEEVTVTTPSYTPSSPQNLTTNFTKSGIHVQWGKSSRPRGTIEYKLFGLINGSRRVFCDECGLHYIIKDVARFTLYTLSVLAYNVHKAYESLPSLKVTIDTGLYVPTIPPTLTVNVSLEGILISWNKSQVQLGSIRYQLMGNENGVKKTFCADCGMKYLINKTEPNMNYSFWVVAQNIESGFKSVPSSVVHFHTTRVRPSAPEHLVAPEVKDSSARITWDPPRGVVEGDEIVGYKVTLFDAFKVLDVTTTESLLLEYNNLTQFSKYYVTVQVLSRGGYGPPSQQLTIQTKDRDECALNDVPCNERAKCINSAGSYFCTCLSGYVGDGNICEALPSESTATDFCPGETARNVTWQKTYHGHTNKNLCPNGTIGISTRECLKGNRSRSYWSDPNLSNCVSAWITAVDDKLADRSLNSSAVGDFFLNLLHENDERGLYGGDVIKSVNMIDLLYNKSKYNELDQQKSNPRIAETFVMNLINITEKIISPENIKVWNDIPKGRRTEHSVRMMDGLDNVALKSAKLVNFSSIQNQYIDVRYGRVSSFKLNKSSWHLDEMESIKFPQQEEEKNVEEQTAAVIKYSTIAEVLSAGDEELNDKDVVNSAVLSITMNPPISTPFQKPLEFKLNNQKNGKFDKHKCAFFNTSRYPGFWSTTGCVVFNVTDNFTVCHCYHMTSFSVLMQVKPAELSYSDELILGWVTRVGLCVSLIALGLAFLTFVFLPRPCGYKSRCFKLCEQGYRPTYLKKIRTSIHANLILSLALGEGLFLWGIEKTENKTTCYTVAVALHYLFLVAFHWMAAEGVILYLVLVKVFQRKSASKDKRMFMIICWGTPAAIVCIAMVVGHEYYLHEQCCWLSVTHGMIWAFVGPALAIILVNIFFLCCTFRVMGRRHSWDKTEKKMADKIRYWAKGAGIVTCLLGVTWVFGVFFLNSDSVVVAYVFTFCNVFQGLFIFIFHCLLDEKIRQQYYQVLCAVAQIESRSRTLSHSTTTTGKKEQRRSTYNSLLHWSVSPMKLHDSKSESCPTVTENTLNRHNSSTHSLSPAIDKRLLEIKRDSDTKPRGMSSIYHDSDENMDNIPDNILTVKHGSKNNSGRLDCQDETGGVFEEYWTSTLSRGNSQEFHEVPEATCEDCLHEMREWEEIQEILNKTNSFHELVQSKRLKEPCSSLEHKNLNKDLTNTNDVDSCQQDNMRDKADELGLLTGEGEQCTSCSGEGEQCTSCSGEGEQCTSCSGEGEQCTSCSGEGEQCTSCSGEGEQCTSYSGESEQCTSYSREDEQCTSFISTAPHIILTPDVSKCKRITTPKCYEMVNVTDSRGVERTSGRKLSCPTCVENVDVGRQDE